VQLRKAFIIAAATCVLVAMSGTSYADDGNGITSTGGDSYMTSTYTPPASVAAAIALKSQQIAAAESQLAAGAKSLRLRVEQRANFKTGKMVASATATPAATVLSYNMPVIYDHKEGAGNPCSAGSNGCSSLGHPTYTCAAASVRNAIESMTGPDPGEAFWVDKLNVTPSLGLPDINNIPSYLNAHDSNYGSWQSHIPSSKDNYFSGITVDTYTYSQPVIQNVQTSDFGYWQHHSTKHYNIVYGWDSQHDNISIDEEWNPVWTYGSSNYGNPYGKHTDIDTTASYNAVLDSPSSRDVI
jgi:hypothetical protein